MTYPLMISIIIAAAWFTFFLSLYKKRKKKTYLITLIYPVIYVLLNIEAINKNKAIMITITIAAIIMAFPTVYYFAKDKE